MVEHGDVFDLVGKHLEAGDVDHVLLAIEDFQKALRVERANVAGMQPAVLGENEFGLVGPPPITLHDLGPAHANLARFADG